MSIPSLTHNRIITNSKLQNRKSKQIIAIWYDNFSLNSALVKFAQPHVHTVYCLDYNKSKTKTYYLKVYTTKKIRTENYQTRKYIVKRKGKMYL